MTTPDAEGIGPSEIPPPVRASDADREAVVAVLHDAVLRGLLNLEEGNERVAAAYGARFLNDLPPLTADLPAAPATAPTGPTAPGWRALALLAWLQLRTVFTRTTMRQVRSRPRCALAVAALLAVLALGAMVGDFGGHSFGPAPRFEHAQHFGPPAPPAPPAGR